MTHLLATLTLALFGHNAFGADTSPELTLEASTSTIRACDPLMFKITDSNALKTVRWLRVLLEYRLAADEKARFRALVRWYEVRKKLDPITAEIADLHLAYLHVHQRFPGEPEAGLKMLKSVPDQSSLKKLFQTTIERSLEEQLKSKN